MRKLKKIVLLIITSLLILIVYMHIESRWLKLNRIEIKSSEIPLSFSHKKIVFISDIHHGPFYSKERLEKLVQRINKLEPDFIIMGGDYVHRKKEYIQPFFDAIQLLNPSFGIYAVMGNHDHWESKELTRKLMKRNGIKICDNQSHWLHIEEDSIKIGGVGDLWTDSQIISPTIFDINKKDYCILISHNPDYIEQLQTDLIDLTLSGHTHGGQVTLFGLWAPILPSKYGQKYRYGYQEYEYTSAYISSGVGTITPPARFFCRPEIVLITLVKE